MIIVFALPLGLSKSFNAIFSTLKKYPSLLWRLVSLTKGFNFYFWVNDFLRYGWYITARFEYLFSATTRQWFPNSFSIQCIIDERAAFYREMSLVLTWSICLLIPSTSDLSINFSFIDYFLLFLALRYICTLYFVPAKLTYICILLPFLFVSYLSSTILLYLVSSMDNGFMLLW